MPDRVTTLPSPPTLARQTKLDAHPWRAGVAFVSCGVRIGIRFDDAALLELMPLYLPPVRRHTSNPIVDHLFSLSTRREDGIRVTRLHQGSRLVARRQGLGPRMQLDLLRSQLESCVATQAASPLFVHAGVVGWRGRAIVLPGRSRSGKTTLVRELVRAGATYYSDEFALLDAAGRVHPWARPLRIRRPGRVPESRPVESLGGRSGRRALPLGLVVLTSHRAGARWRPRLLSPGSALLALMRHTLVARSQPRRTLEVLARAARAARAIESRRDDAADVALTLLSEASRERRRPQAR